MDIGTKKLTLIEKILKIENEIWRCYLSRIQL